MLDIKVIEQNPKEVKKNLANRNGKFPIDELIKLNAKRKKLILKVEEKKAFRNKTTKDIAALKKAKKDTSKLIASMKTLGAEIKKADEAVAKCDNKIKDCLLNIPNTTHASVPAGKDSSDNKEVRKSLSPTKFDFKEKAHWDLGASLNILDWPRAAKISGARFTVYRGLGAQLERAVTNFMLDLHLKQGYTEIFPPFIVNRNSMIGTGQLPKFEEDMYKLGTADSDYYLIPTAEVPVTNLHRDEILKEDDLTISYCAYTACFRAEAGSAGRDTRGLIRQHQFNKVELVKFAHPENSYKELEKLTNDAEEVLQKLNLPYRVVTLCTGDTGFSSAKTYDLEVWMPSYNNYVEISSCSNFESFQARRANIKFRNKNGKTEFVHTLNGSGLAVGRTVAAIIENYQNADGSVSIPKVLQKYMNTDIIK